MSSTAVAAGTPDGCEKVPYRSKVWADRAAQEHRDEAGVCNGCRRGGRMQAYPCKKTKPGHWHIGHQWRSRRVLASVDVEMVVGFILGAMVVGAVLRSVL